MPRLLTLLALALLLGACGDDATQKIAAPVCADACEAPPASACVDQGTLRVFTAPGVCEADDTCAYAHADVACPNGCRVDACVPPDDPCDGVVCDAPPACHGAGECRDGGCVYAPLTGDACDDGDLCTTADTCQSGTCVGAAATCDDPPAATCLDADRLQVTATQGTCNPDGSCAYEGLTVDCPLGCADGACVGDACAGVSCTTPPSPCHAPVGLCTAGTCDYAIITGVACDDGDACTTDDRCRADATCRGAARACTAPPAPTCADGGALTVYADQGTCGGDGACTYAPQQVACANGCAAGACLGDPCADVTCDTPPSPCHDPAGTCANGVCSYALDDGAACDDGDPCTAGDACLSGACDGEPIACDAPPANVCADANTLRVYASAGQCGANGGCTYNAQTAPCTHGCADGACLGDPCANVTCDTPPAPSCANANTLTTWSPTGTCAAGACSYASTTTTCFNGCAAGACTAPTGFTLSEVLVDSTGFPDTDAFVELHGPPGAPLDGLSLIGVNGNGGAVYVTIPLSGNLDSAGIYVIAHPDADAWVTDMADVTDERVDLQNGPDNVQLRFGATVLDALGYGSFTTTVFAGEGTPHPTAPTNASLFRDADFTDTDDNLADFTAGLPTPGTATPPPIPLDAVLTAAPGPHAIDDAVAFDAGASTGPIATYTFDFGDGSTPVSGADPTATHAYAAAGTFTATLTIADDAGATDVATVAVTVEAPIPLVAAVTASAGPHVIDDVVTFDASASTGPIATYSFDFGDGSAPVSGADPTATHAYAAAGTFTATLTIADGAGATDVATVDVVVDAPTPTEPVAFAPGTCDGAPWSPAAALERLGTASYVVLDTAYAYERRRSCPGGTCTAWSEPEINYLRYLTWSGGVTTRYTDPIATQVRLVLWKDNSGAPRLSIRHVTLSATPNDNRDDIKFAFPPQPILYLTMNAYRPAPHQHPYDYTDLEQDFLRDGRLSLSSGCARFLSYSPTSNQGPATLQYAILFDF